MIIRHLSNTFLVAMLLAVTGCNSSAAPGGLSLDTAYPNLLSSLAGYQLENLAEEVVFISDLGGELTLEVVQLNRSDLFYSRDSLYTQHIYDQCRLGAEQGESILDGTLQTIANDIAGRHFTIKDKQVNWTSFSWISGNGSAIESDATLGINEFSSFNFEISRQAEISNYSNTR